MPYITEVATSSPTQGYEQETQWEMPEESKCISSRQICRALFRELQLQFFIARMSFNTKSQNHSLIKAQILYEESFYNLSFWKEWLSPWELSIARVWTLNNGIAGSIQGIPDLSTQCSTALCCIKKWVCSSTHHHATLANAEEHEVTLKDERVPCVFRKGSFCGS